MKMRCKICGYEKFTTLPFDDNAPMQWKYDFLTHLTEFIEPWHQMLLEVYSKNHRQYYILLRYIDIVFEKPDIYPPMRTNRSYWIYQYLKYYGNFVFEKKMGEDFYLQIEKILERPDDFLDSIIEDEKGSEKEVKENEN